MPADCTSAAISIVTSISSTLIGVGLGGVIGYLSARKVSDRNELATARAKFRAAFAPALARVKAATNEATSVDDVDLSRYLRRSLEQHAAAVEEFRPFISKKRASSYQHAWEDYLDLEVARGEAEYHSVSNDPDDPHGPIRRRIEALLAYSQT